VSDLLLDSASLYYRSFYALPTSIRSPDGRPVNAVRGFLDTLARLLIERTPTGVVCCWDDDWRPQWRVDEIPSYKSHRVADVESGAEEEPDELGHQIQVIRDCLSALGVPVVGATGYEADDVIATLAGRAAAHCDIVSGDRDLLALVTEDVHVLYTGRAGVPWTEYTPATVTAAFGVSPAQYPDLALLRGDPSDGLPGVRGIGQKTAVRLLAEYHTIERILEAAADPDSVLTPAIRRALLGGADYIARARRVIYPVRDVPVSASATVMHPPDDTTLAELGSSWNLTAVLGRVRAALPTPDPTAGE